MGEAVTALGLLGGRRSWGRRRRLWRWLEVKVFDGFAALLTASGDAATGACSVGGAAAGSGFELRHPMGGEDVSSEI